VCAPQVMLLVEVGVERGGVLGRPVRGERCGRAGGERAAYDLLDGPGVQVYAGAEARHDGSGDQMGGIGCTVVEPDEDVDGLPRGDAPTWLGEILAHLLEFVQRSSSDRHDSTHGKDSNMALTTLGKRKRITRERLEQTSKNNEASDDEDVHDLFRRAFEAKFKPLDIEPKKPKIAEATEDDEEAWSGISSAGEEEQDTIQVIQHTSAHPKQPSLNTAAKQAVSASTKEKKKADDDDPAEASNLKNDLALQRLLRDSHLLSANSSSTFSPSTASNSTPTSTSVAGELRHKSMDLHLRSMGAKKSIHAQKSMPMSHRKGMTAKSQRREEKRKAEAKENGIILEKEAKTRKFSGKRESGVGGPGIGKFKGGTLNLSKADVRSITGGGSSGAKARFGKKSRR
jgi:hypothetical protein